MPIGIDAARLNFKAERNQCQIHSCKNTSPFGCRNVAGKGIKSNNPTKRHNQMRLTVFGATGRTGRHVVEQAISAGHEVTILVRERSKVRAQSPHLKVI